MKEGEVQPPLPEKKFCKYCGKPLAQVTTEYSEFTGKPLNLRKQCASALCRNLKQQELLGW